MGKFSFGNLVGIWRQLGRMATKGRRDLGNCRLDKSLTPSGLDERLVPNVNVDGSHGILFLKRCKCNFNLGGWRIRWGAHRTAS